MGRHVAGDAPEMDRLVDEACAGIGREVSALQIPRLAGVVLGGGYGRGEGGVRERNAGSGKCEVEGASAAGCRLSNDLDFFAIAVEGSTDADASAVAAALEPVSRRWTERLGIDVDFTARTPWRLRHDQERLMVQELVNGYFDVAGEKGETLFAGIERRDPSALPWMEAARLLMNRGMGLLLAMAENRKSCSSEPESGSVPSSSPNSSIQHPSNPELGLSCNRDFVSRNINKCILGAGDAFLISRGLYRWRAEERAAALASQGDDGLYARAVEWKFRPREEPVCGWETARGYWLDTMDEVAAAVDELGYRRSLRSAARWLARRRTVGDFRTLGQDPVVRVLDGVERCVRERLDLPPSLRRDWEIFN